MNEMEKYYKCEAIQSSNNGGNVYPKRDMSYAHFQGDILRGQNYL